MLAHPRSFHLGAVGTRVAVGVRLNRSFVPQSQLKAPPKHMHPGGYLPRHVTLAPFARGHIVVVPRACLYARSLHFFPQEIAEAESQLNIG